MKSLQIACTLLLAVSIGLSSCSSKKLSISGTIAGIDSGTVYIEQVFLNQAILIDSCQINSSHQFELNTSLTEKSICRITYGNQFEWEVILDNQSYNIQLTTDSVPIAIVDASSENELLLDFNKSLGALYLDLANLSNAYKLALFAGKDAKQEQEDLKEKVAETHQTILDFIATCPSPFVQLYALNFLPIEDFFPHYLSQLQILKEKLPTSTYTTDFEEHVKTYQEHVATNTPPVTIGNTAPNITLFSAKDKVLSLHDLKGKVVLLDFWASWCRPCRLQNPAIVKLYDQYADKGFEIYSVSLDQSKEKWLQAITEDNLHWPSHVWDEQKVASKQYEVHAIPTTLLIDRNGIVIGKNLHGKPLEKEIQKALRQQDA